jgi:alpha-beta hydrolase superfamily lysophospholipase
MLAVSVSLALARPDNDATKRKSHMLRRILKILAVLVISVAMIQVIWYQIDGLPTPAADEYLSGEQFTVTTEPDGSYWFEPNSPNGAGIVIMHGALILPKSYARSAAFFASRGYAVYLPRGALRMSIAATGKVAERIKGSALRTWFFIGHSMGGLASMQTITSHDLNVSGVALWASGMSADFSAQTVPMLFIWGDTDGLMPAERFAQARANLPADVRYVTLEGANHKNFAMYSHQTFDNEATLDWAEQIDFANTTTLEFFNGLL